MKCADWREKIDPYLDTELSRAEVQDLEAHLKDCPACSAEALARSQLKRSVHLAGQAFSPSAALRARMEQEIRPSTPVRRWLWAPQLAGAVIVLLLAVAASMLWLREVRSRQIVSELTDLHVATLASSNRVDVVSSDRHTVKPWFQGRVPFTFDLPELAGSPFELLGGRLTYLDQEPGAELLFQVRKHLLSVFVFRDSAELDRALAGGALRKLSFNVESWQDNGLRYVIVTDAAQADASDLRARFAQAAR